MQNSPNNPFEKKTQKLQSEVEHKTFPSVDEEDNFESLETQTSSEAPVQEISNTSHPISVSPVASMQASSVIAQADEELAMIEGILSEGMETLYHELAPAKKQEFKQKGEEVARNIRAMMSSVKVQTKKIIDWIVEWLRIIPHVNKFFLKQEAKLKTDKIVKYIEDQNKR